MRFSVIHNGIPIGGVELAVGELVAGQLAPLPMIDPLRETLRAGSNALLSLGFFGAATEAGSNGAGGALRAAAALQFELVDERGEVVPTTFVNVIDAPDGGLVVLARFGHAHASVGAAVQPKPRSDSAHNDAPTTDAA